MPKCFKSSKIHILWRTIGYINQKITSLKKLALKKILIYLFRCGALFRVADLCTTLMNGLLRNTGIKDGLAWVNTVLEAATSVHAC